jgi:monoamine oxidase
VLQSANEESAVLFEPKVPLLKQINLLAVGAAIRMSFLFRERVWEDAAPGAGFILSREPHFPTWWPRESKSGYVLTGWIGGPKAHGLPVQSKDRMAEIAIATLAKLFARKDRELWSRVESVHYHDWHSDPFSLGSYSYVNAGGYEFSQRFAEPVEQTLWFAGEAASRDGYWGTVHGAIESGRRAAEQIAGEITAETA